MKIFVLIPLGKSYFDKFYEEVITKVLEDKYGKNCLQKGEMPYSGVIPDYIFTNIIEADIVLADVTPYKKKNSLVHNPNVFYELGIRHTLRKRSIILCSKNKGSELAFDVRDLNHIFYGPVKSLLRGKGIEFDKFKTDLINQVDEAIAKKDRSDNRVWSIWKNKERDLNNKLNSEWKIHNESSWHIEPGHRFLTVTGSHLGGVTKTGQNWQNIKMEFEIRIRKRNGAFIVGAITSPQEPICQNYIMFQLTIESAQSINPHRLLGMQNPFYKRLNIPSQEPNWIIPRKLSRAHSMRLDNWSKIRYESDSNETKIIIDDKVMFTEKNTHIFDEFISKYRDKLNREKDNMMEFIKANNINIDLDNIIKEELGNFQSFLLGNYSKGICGSIGFRNDFLEVADFRNIKVLSMINDNPIECYSFL